jgi:protein Mpv17
MPIVHFVLFTIFSCPPNFLWQEYLEEQFPGYTAGIDGQQKLHKTNTAKKFTLDQTLGAAVNTLLFIAVIGAFQGKDGKAIVRDCQRVCLNTRRVECSANGRQNFWPIAKSGLKLWPLVSLLNFTIVPVHRRVVVGSLVGLFWGIYLSLMVSGNSH